MNLLEGPELGMHYWKDGEEKIPRRLAGFEPTTSLLWGVCSTLCYNHRDLSIHIEGVLCETFFWPVTYRPKMETAKARKLWVRTKIILFSQTVQDHGNRSDDICLVMQAVGQAGHSLYICILRSYDCKPLPIYKWGVVVADRWEKPSTGRHELGREDAAGADRDRAEAGRGDGRGQAAEDEAVQQGLQVRWWLRGISS